MYVEAPTADNSHREILVTEKLVGRCSFRDALFEELNLANAAQNIGVEFSHHNASQHQGAAHLETPYLVHIDTVVISG